MNSCLDAFSTTFDAFTPMLNFHEQQDAQTEWRSCRVNSLTVAPLDASSPLSYSSFAGKCSQEAVDDTKAGLGLAMGLYDGYYPIRDTAYKSLLDRAKISGSALPKLSRTVLAAVLNECLHLHSAEALLLLREGKISAVHSGDAVDYSVLPISELLGTLKTKLDARFPGNVFLAGYTDHAITSASWQLPDQREDLLGTYAKLLAANGKATMAGRLTPGVRFITSDTGVASAKVSALLTGGQHPIHIGSCVAVDHRHQSKIADFESAMDQLFAQFGDAVSKLQALMEVHLDYPINAMTRVCKKLSMPKKAADEAIAMFEMAYGDNPATAHGVFMAMQEIPYILKTEHTPESKLLTIEENLARAMSLRWSEFDRARAVS